MLSVGLIINENWNQTGTPLWPCCRKPTLSSDLKLKKGHYTSYRTEMGFPFDAKNTISLDAGELQVGFHVGLKESRRVGHLLASSRRKHGNLYFFEHHLNHMGPRLLANSEDLTP